MSPRTRRTSPKAKSLRPDKTSILNNYVMCDHCGKKEKNKQSLKLHIAACVINRTCSWCNIVFRNRGNLYSHSLHLHGKKLESKTGPPKSYICAVCPKKYSQITNLKYHVRKDHFNMESTIAEGELRDINAVWIERVQNTDALIEIRKTGPNAYLMQRAKETDVKVTECKTVDLSTLYPTCSRLMRVMCNLCKKTYYKREFKKHINETHRNIKQHSCNNCDKSFTRTYQFLKHVCSKRRGKWERRNKEVVEEKSITIED